MRLATATVFLCLIAFPAQALPCWAVRKAVATYGETAALHWAKSNGYSAHDISEARKCLRR